jgi:hypothetical protein
MRNRSEARIVSGRRRRVDTLGGTSRMREGSIVLLARANIALAGLIPDRTQPFQRVVAEG